MGEPVVPRARGTTVQQATRRGRPLQRLVGRPRRPLGYKCYRLSSLCMLAHARRASAPKGNDVMASSTKPCAS